MARVTKESSYPRPLLTGSIALDRIMNFSGKFADIIAPEKLHVLSISVLLQELKETRGGIAANIAYSLALLGERPILYGSVGSTTPKYMEDLSLLGIDTSYLHWSEFPTASFTVLTDSANCQVGGFYPGAMSDAASLTIETFAKDNVFVVISAHDPGQMKRQVQECRMLKKRLFYDVGQQVINIPDEDVREGIEAAELLIVNDYEMGLIVKKTGWSQKTIINKLKVCVITLGEQGSSVYTQGTSLHVPSLEGLNVVDPTGAGDAYRAGFLYGYIRGISPDVCAKLGSVCAAYAIETYGTQEHTFTLTSFANRYTQAYGETFPVAHIQEELV